MQLNKYLTSCGILSRRKAADAIKKGMVCVNDLPMTDPGYRVQPTDVVSYEGHTLKPLRKIYIVLNKPKGYITTREDEKDRKTVMDLLVDIKEQLHPIGRLDRNTTGVLLLTNDGELTQKLTHPKFEILKLYKVTADRALLGKNMDTMRKGIQLEDGFIKPDSLISKGPEALIAIHSGKTRIVRRMFEYFDYDIKKLDRFSFAGIGKEGIPLGRWRHLTNEEVAMLKKL